MTTLKMLEIAEIASPCDADWDRMTGNDSVRHCEHCQMDVYDVGKLSEVDAEAVRSAHADSVCIRRRIQNAHGDCDFKPAKTRRRGFTARVFFALSWIWAFLFAGCRNVNYPGHIVMGAYRFPHAVDDQAVESSLKTNETESLEQSQP